MPGHLALIVLLSWAPAALALGWAIGPRRAALVALLGGFLFLPRDVRWEALGPLTVDRWTVAGPSALLVVLAFDRKALSRLRPAWPDLAVLALVLAQPFGSMARGFARPGESADQAWMALAEWAIPYAIGRLYFADSDGPGRVARAIVVGGLAYLPICWFEAILGPDWYLSNLLYGSPPREGMVHRLGGYRPEAFLNNGLQLAAWMATASVAASWLALSRPGPGPPGPGRPARVASAVALCLTTLACRGVYGYAVLALGLASTAITLGLRTRLILMALLLVPPAYMVARSSGAWDGRELRGLARRAGREGTVGARLDAEDRILREVSAHGLAFGRGGRSPDGSADGWWIGCLSGGGVVGLSALYAAALVPAGLAIFGPARRFPARSVGSGLALLVVINMIDGLHNANLLTSTPLIGGALVGASLARRPPPAADRRQRAAPEARSPRRPAVALMATLVVLAAIEALGLATRTPWAAPGTPAGVGRPGGPAPEDGHPPR